jgi:glycosyltransferase involved in cell wall biosynthesis
MSTSKLKEISVFFPCFNEQENIPKLVGNALEVLPSITENYQIILVNDGSTDQTKLIAQKYVDQNEHVELVSHETNRGYGAALRTGFLSAKKELVFYTDGDNQFDIKELPRLIELKDKYDIVSGYRLQRQDSFTRKLNAAIYNFTLFVLFGLRVKDVDCAFKLYKRELFDKIKIISNGALVDAEILIKAKRLGYKIGQCGVSHYPRAAGKQTGANIKVILRAFKEIIKLRLKI